VLVPQPLIPDATRANGASARTIVSVLSNTTSLAPPAIQSQDDADAADRGLRPAEGCHRLEQCRHREVGEEVERA
jgi:hypothetical protein